MSVLTLTREEVIAKGEEVVARVCSDVRIPCAGDLDRIPEVALEAPEVEAFRQVIATSDRLAVGISQSNGCGCPMAQTVFGFGPNPNVMVLRLAYAWDDTFLVASTVTVVEVVG